MNLGSAYVMPLIVTFKCIPLPKKYREKLSWDLILDSIAGNVCLLLELCVYCWKCVFIAGNVCLLLEICVYCWKCVSILGN